MNGFDPYGSQTFDRMTGGVTLDELNGTYQTILGHADPRQGAGYYVPNAPPASTSLVGQVPPPSSASPQAQVSDQLQQRMILIGVLAVLAGAAVIYQTRKK